MLAFFFVPPMLFAMACCLRAAGNGKDCCALQSTNTLVSVQMSLSVAVFDLGTYVHMLLVFGTGSAQPVLVHAFPTAAVLDPDVELPAHQL